MNRRHIFGFARLFESIWNHPQAALKKFKRCDGIITPDFSLYADTPLWLQIANVAKNRWVGAYWQGKGLSVVPTISWGTAQSFKFCFDGVEENSIVAVGMIGSKKDNHLGFMRGYNEMLERINPQAIICYGEPFPEMTGNIIKVSYRTFCKAVG